MVVMLRESVGLVADILKEPQGEGTPTQYDRVRQARDVDLFLLLRQRDDSRRGLLQGGEGIERRVELSLAAVDQKDIGMRLLPLAEALNAAADHLADRGVVVDALDALNLVASVPGLEG